MQSDPVEISFAIEKESSDFAVKTEENELANTTSSHGVKDLINEPVVSSDKDAIHDSIKDDEPCDASKQLVVYEPKENGSHESDSIPDPSSDNQTGNVSNEVVLYDPKENVTHKHPVPRVLPAVGAFTVQCANCFKWRLIPTKEKYEEIREHIMDQPFVCDAAREWKPETSCDDPPDIQPDGSRLWAIDKPSIAQPPPGWERELRIRGEGSSKFADVYYIAPTGKKLRSMVDIQKYLLEHPEYSQGVIMSRFSFQIPKPLQENYVRKRARVITPCNNSKLTPSRPLELDEASPLSAVDPAGHPILRLGGFGLSDAYSTETPPAKQQKTSDSSPIHSNERLQNRIKIKISPSSARPPTNDAI